MKSDLDLAIELVDTLLAFKSVDTLERYRLHQTLKSYLESAKKTYEGDND